MIFLIVDLLAFCLFEASTKLLHIFGRKLKIPIVMKNNFVKVVYSRHAKCTEQAERCLGKFFLARVIFWTKHTHFHQLGPSGPSWS